MRNTGWTLKAIRLIAVNLCTMASNVVFFLVFSRAHGNRLQDQPVPCLLPSPEENAGKRDPRRKRFFSNLPNEWRSSARSIKLWLDPHSLSTFEHRSHRFGGKSEIPPRSISFKSLSGYFCTLEFPPWTTDLDRLIDLLPRWSFSREWFVQSMRLSLL